jgi:hypothetical protein
MMRGWLPILCWVLLWFGQGAVQGVDLRNRSTSTSGQFTVYCDDRTLRWRVVSFVEETKREVLTVLKDQDRWRIPVVVSLELKATPTTGKGPVRLHWVPTTVGPKIDIQVTVGEDPAAVHLQKHIIRAVLLEIAYRQHQEATQVIEPPWWLVEGILHAMYQRTYGPDSDLFQSIVKAEHLPQVDRLVSAPPMELGETGKIVDRACAYALVQALLEMPEGSANLTRFISTWSTSRGDALAHLRKHFPAAAESDEALAKWWSLQLARFSAANRFRALNVSESEVELGKLLDFEVPMDKSGKFQRFPIRQYERFQKLPAARGVLQAQGAMVAALGARVHALYRPFIMEYSRIYSLLAEGKGGKKTGEELDRLELDRIQLLQQMQKITDYLNWYEATQIPQGTSPFESFLRLAKRDEQIPEPVPEPSILISEYLNALEAEFRTSDPSAP